MHSAGVPTGRYLTCTWSVRPDAGGQTKALLMRNRLLHEAGVQPWILSFVPMRSLTEVRHALLEKGQMLPGTRLEGIYDHYRESGWSGEESADRPIADLRKHAVAQEHRPDGTPWRTTYRLGPTGATVFDYQREDGSTYLRIPVFSFTDRATWPGRIQQVSHSGTVVGRFDSLGDWFRAWVREIACGERAFVFLEARVLTPHLVPMADENVYLIQVTHSVHLRPPYRWDSRMAQIEHLMVDRISDMDALVTLTRRQHEDIALRRGATNNMFVVPNPVEMPTAGPCAPRDPRLVTIVARLSGKKRLTQAFDAFGRVLEKIPEARLDVYGEGTSHDTLQRYIDRRGLSRSITLRGYDPRAREALARSSAFLMTSRTEGYPLSTLESMSHGCPVVSYDIKYGPREQIIDGVDGFLVHPGDVAAVADRVVRLLESPELVTRMSAAAVTKAEQHSTGRHLEDWARVLQAVLEQKGRRTSIRDAALVVTQAGVERAETRGPATGVHGLDDVLVLTAVLTVTGTGRTRSLSDARVELDAVHLDSGEVVRVPIKVEREERVFEVGARVALRDVVGTGSGPTTVHLRLRFVWENSVWETRVGRSVAPDPGVEVTHCDDGTFTMRVPG